MHSLTPCLQCNNAYHAIHDAWIEKAMTSEKLFSIVEKVFLKDVELMFLTVISYTAYIYY